MLIESTSDCCENNLIRLSIAPGYLHQVIYTTKAQQEIPDAPELLKRPVALN